MIRKSLSTQLKEKIKKPVEKEMYDGDISLMTSTGCTLLDLALTGTRIRGGGIPAGIAVEIFGKNSAGKTVLLCEIAGNIQRNGGDVTFNDSEARLDKQFAQLFGFNITDKTIKNPDTIKEVFDLYRTWKPEGIPPHGIIADSIAALSTEGEMKETKGYDGAKRANDFSTGFRKTCRALKEQKSLLVFSNQLRAKMDAGLFGKKTQATGGYAPKYYTSLRLDIKMIEKIETEKIIHGKKHKNVNSIKSEIYVEKSSVDKPFRKAPLYIDFDYGIDDIKGNLIFIKQNSKHKKYAVNDEEVGSNVKKACQFVEDNDLENDLKENVIDLWEEIQEAFKVKRKKKVR